MVSWEIWEVDNLNLLAVVVYLFMFGNNNVMNVGKIYDGHTTLPW